MKSRQATFLLVPLMLAAAAPASAASRSAGSHPGWKQQLGGVRPKPATVKVQTASGRTVGVKQVQYPGSPYTVQDLLARRALNPARFDRFHPTIGRLLQRELVLLNADCTTQRNGLLALTPYHRYLIYRRSLDPQRFDTYHPMLGPLIAEDQRLRNVVCTTPLQPSILLPPPSGVNNPGRPPGPIPPGPPGGRMTGVPPSPPSSFVPEPSGLTLMAIGVLSFAGPRLARRLRRRAQ